MIMAAGPAPEETGPDMETMSAAHMTRLLGPWSSHPRHGLSRLLAWYALAVLPIVAAVAVTVWWLSRDLAAALTFFIDHGRTFAVFGLPGIAFAISLGLTAATATCAARSAAFVADSKGQGRTVAWILGLMFLVGTLAWVVPLAVRAPPTVRTFVALFGLLPLVFLFLLPAFLQATASNQPIVTSGRWWAVALPTAVAAIGLLSRVRVVADSLASLPMVDRIVCLVADAMPSSDAAASIHPVVRGWIVTGIVCLAAVPAMAALLVLFDTLQDGMRRWRSGRAAALPDEASTAPEWIPLVAEQVDPERECGDWVPRPFATESLSGPSSPADICNVFFADAPASVDQAAGFREITARASEICADASDGPWWEHASADLVLEGPRGSGRTALAIATVMHAVLVRGETVLVLVPGDSKRTSLAKRIDRAASRLGVGHLVHVSELTATSVEEWAAPPRPVDEDSATQPRVAGGEAGVPTADGHRRPHVIVGTLADFEHHFFAGVHNHDRLRTVLCSVGLVIVEDVDLFATHARIHLPFMLAKLRLLLATEGVGCQTVVTAPPLADAARTLVERQLLSNGAGVRPGVRLRPMALPPGVAPAWVVKLAPPVDADHTAEEFVEACAAACLDAGIDAVVYSPLLSATDLESIEQRSLAESGLRVRAIAEVDDWDAIEPADHGRVAAALHAARRGAAVGLALVGARAGEAPVVFAVSPPGAELTEREPEHGLMVLPGRESPTLFAQHYCSVAKFVGRLRPAPRNLWTALGLPGPGELARLPAPASGTGRPFVDRIVLLDPPDGEAPAVPPELWPWGAVAGRPETGVPTANPVDVNRTVDATMSIATATDLASLTVRQRESDAVAVDDPEHRSVMWLGPDGGELGRGDLAYTNGLRLEGMQRVFVPSRIDDPGRGAVRIQVRPWSDRDAAGQAFMPLYDLVELAFPPTLTVAPALLSSQLPQRIAVYVLVNEDKSRRFRAASKSERQFASLKLRGIYDESGIVRPCEAVVRYEAAKFLVVLDPPGELSSPERIRADLLVPWGEGRPADREIIPELGAAFTFAMRWQAPGLERLVRCIGVGVRDTESARRRLALVFFEPRSTESSGFALMEPIVCDRAVMAEFFGAAASLLEQCRDASNPAATLYAHAESCIGAQLDGRRLAVNLANVSEAQSLLRSIADEAAARP